MTSEWRDDAPDWQDSQGRVEIQTDDGLIVAGTLWVKDMFFDGEDEAPIFEMTADTGDVVDFYGAARWRYI